MKLQLNHVATSAQGTRYQAGLIIVVLACLWCGWQLVEMRAGQRALTQQWEQMQQDSKPVQVVVIQPQALSAAQKSEIKEANKVLDELGRPWPVLLQRLEQVSTPDIALLAIRPDAAKGKLRLKGEAKDIASLLAYLRQLEALPEMHDVTLDEHEMMEKSQDGGTENFIRFGLTARWNAP